MKQPFLVWVGLAATLLAVPAAKLNRVRGDALLGDDAAARRASAHIVGDTLPEARAAIARAHGGLDAIGEPDAGAGTQAKEVLAGDGRAAALARLALAVRRETATSRLRFDVVLPAAGGELDLFDVMGRRLVHRDLSGMLPGSHTLWIDAGGIPAGLFWARVRLGGESVTRRVVWVR